MKTGLLLNCYAEASAPAILGLKGIAIGGTFGGTPDPTYGLVIGKNTDYNMSCSTGLELNPRKEVSAHGTYDQDGLVINLPSASVLDYVRLNKVGTGPIARLTYEGKLFLGANAGGAKIHVMDYDVNGGIEIGSSQAYDGVTGIKLCAKEATDPWNYVHSFPASATGGLSNALALLSQGNVILNAPTWGGGTPGNVGVGEANPTSKFEVKGDVNLGNTAGSKVGFMGATPIVRPTVTGSKGGNAALGSLLTALANLGLITDSST